MRLTKVSLEAPEGLLEMYADAGDGENGFYGESDLIAGRLSLQKHLQNLVAMSEGRTLRPGWVSMTTYWLLDTAGTVVGLSRLRHSLTPQLLIDGGHIGYYVRPGYRGKGHGTTTLKLTLVEARTLGLERVLLTVRPGNTPSVRIIEGQGGLLEDERADPETGATYRRYWIDLV
jgi:predicted acetyltransferase